ALVLLLYAWRKGRLRASSVPSFMLVALIAASHFGLAMDFPWECKSGRRAMGPGGSLTSGLPDQTAPLEVLVTKPELLNEGAPVIAERVRALLKLPSGREIRFVLVEDMLEKIAESPNITLGDLVVIGQADGEITRRDDVEDLLKTKRNSYLIPRPDILSFAFNGPRGESGARFVTCAIDQKAVGGLETEDAPLDTAVYDLISVGFKQPNQLPSGSAWLEWYREGSQSPAGRAVKEIQAGQATFMLRHQLDWLAAGKVTRITTGLVDADAIPFLGAMCIRRQPSMRK
ncbi:hypothetical protein J7M28_08950, partial [bacterium]|nr:hypothetical protein [bacterium]